MTNGRPTIAGNSLLGAMIHHKLDAIDATEKDEMRLLALRGGHYTEAEKSALLDYCESDVTALEKLLPRMLPQIDLPRALYRGGYMKAVARMETNGIPIDVNLDSFSGPLPKYFMQQNFLILTRELARMKRREAAGHTTYSPILIDDRPVAMVKFMAENAAPPAVLKMALAEKAEHALLPLFMIQWDEESMWFYVTPYNQRAGVYLTAATWLSVDELLQLFDYCRYR